MKHLQTFKGYLIQEVSKNDPIPELIHNEDKLAIFLMGSPGAGKSTYISNFIQPRRRDIRTFSSDDISLMFTKDPNVRHRGAGELNIKRIDVFMETGQSFIYDTTPTYSGDKVDLINKAKDNGYKVIFIALITPLDVALKRNQERARQASEDFLRHTYGNIWSKLSQHRDLKPDSFYVITDLNNKYTYYKYDADANLLKRKGSKYI